MGKKRANRANIGGKNIMEWGNSNIYDPEEENIETLKKLHQDAYNDFINENDQHNSEEQFIKTHFRSKSSKWFATNSKQIENEDEDLGEEIKEEVKMAVVVEDKRSKWTENNHDKQSVFEEHLYMTQEESFASKKQKPTTQDFIIT